MEGLHPRNLERIHLTSNRMSVRKDGHAAWLTFNRPDKLNLRKQATDNRLG
jgi:enoyl-CoA hydratase/carnithine racemase